MKLYILTQEDAFYIPKLIGGFLDKKPASCQVVGASILQGEIDAKNVGAYFQLLGPVGFVQTGFHFAYYKAMDMLDGVVGFDASYSVRGLFGKREIRCYDEHPKINTPEFLQLMRDLEVDLIISVACPQIVRQNLLDVPPKGVINIHGALLPKYRGKLPSFWVLAHGEKETGVTVHYMNVKLDDGPIIVQKRVPISPDDTLHSLILKSKVNFGADALAEAVSHIVEDTVELQENNREEATYFSFPTEEAIVAFRAQGRKIR